MIPEELLILGTLLGITCGSVIEYLTFPF